MKRKILFGVAVAVALLCGQGGFAAGTNDIIADLNAVVVKVNAKVQQGGTTEKDFCGRTQGVRRCIRQIQGSKD